MAGSNPRGCPRAARRLLGALLLALLFVGAERAGAFDAPDGCKNPTLLHVPAAAFPRVLPLTTFCPFEPRTDCIGEAVPSRSRLHIRQKPGVPNRDRFSWKLRKAASMTPGVLGDPTQDTGYELCVYVEVAGSCSLILHPDAAAGSGWKRRHRGFAFKAKAGVHPDGIRKLRLRTGKNGRGRIVVKGKGPLLDLEALPMPEGASILVQLYNDEDQCWSTEFGAAPLIDTDRRYKDRSD